MVIKETNMKIQVFPLLLLKGTEWLVKDDVAKYNDSDYYQSNGKYLNNLENFERSRLFPSPTHSFLKSNMKGKMKSCEFM